mmetsp:Transcript_4178/g.15764  ORF Transcript_4178/g.15764 Transcript_4178/m.15764 type:complete len:83 (-) Transcript_4178:4-252(-)
MTQALSETFQMVNSMTKAQYTQWMERKLIHYESFQRGVVERDGDLFSGGKYRLYTNNERARARINDRRMDINGCGGEVDSSG